MASGRCLSHLHNSSDWPGSSYRFVNRDESSSRRRVADRQLILGVEQRALRIEDLEKIS